MLSISAVGLVLQPKPTAQHDNIWNFFFGKKNSRRRCWVLPRCCRRRRWQNFNRLKKKHFRVHRYSRNVKQPAFSYVSIWKSSLSIVNSYESDSDMWYRQNCSTFSSIRWKIHDKTLRWAREKAAGRCHTRNIIEQDINFQQLKEKHFIGLAWLFLPNGILMDSQLDKRGAKRLTQVTNKFSRIFLAMHRQTWIMQSSISPQSPSPCLNCLFSSFDRLDGWRQDTWKMPPG